MAGIWQRAVSGVDKLTLLQSILGDVITADIAVGHTHTHTQKQPLLSHSFSPNPQGIEYPPYILSCYFITPPPLALSFERAANFWALLLERV